MAIESEKKIFLKVRFRPCSFNNAEVCLFVHPLFQCDNDMKTHLNWLP